METTRHGSRCTTLESDPLADPIMQIISGARNFKLLENALEIGIFDDLQTSVDPVPAERLAKKHDFNVDKLTRFMDALCAIHLVGKTTTSKGKSLYYNSAGTNKYLTRSRKPTLVPSAMMEDKMVLPLMGKMPMLLKNDKSMDVMSKSGGVNTTQILQGPPKPPSIPSSTDNANNNATDPIKAIDAQMKFLMCMDGLAAPCAHALVSAFDLSANTTAVDLGGGSGAIAIELAKTYPSMEVTILDLPHVVQIAKKMQHNLPDNASFLQGNFFEGEIPDADLYMLGHVIHDWDDDHVSSLLNIVFNKMPPGGSLLVLEKMLEPKKDGPELAVTSNLLMSMITKGRERTEQEYRALLSAHGFVNTTCERVDGFNWYDAILTKKPL